MKRGGKLSRVVLVTEVVIMTITVPQNAVLVMVQEKRGLSQMVYNGCRYIEEGLCVEALSKNLKLTTTLNRATTQNPCYVSFLFGL